MTGPAPARAARSYLYVPGDQPDKLARALDRGADAVIVDLEDAVAPDRRPAARAAVAAWLHDLPGPPGPPGPPGLPGLPGLPAAQASAAEVWVRVNPGPAGHDDARAVVAPALAGVVAAKTETAADLADLDRVLAEAEVAAGREPGSVAVVPLVESAAAVLRAAEIAGAPRVRRVQAGEADLTGELGLSPGEDGRELLYLRSHLVLVSAAHRLDPPVGPVSTDFRDLDRFRRSTQALARLGFVGRACIHPAQVAVANEVFTPTPEEVAQARALVADFDRAVAEGRGVLTDSAGRMVDEAVVRRARRLLDRAR